MPRETRMAAPVSLIFWLCTAFRQNLHHMQRMKVNLVPASQYLIVNRIVFECADVVFVFVSSGNLHPHPFDLAILSIGHLCRKAEKELDVHTGRQIISHLLWRWLHVVAVLRHPHGIFQIVTILLVSGEWIVLFPCPPRIDGSAG